MAKIEKDCVDMKFALEQCCGDEELLSELLEGLPEEIEAQNKEMEKGIKANDHTVCKLLWLVPSVCVIHTPIHACVYLSLCFIFSFAEAV